MVKIETNPEEIYKFHAKIRPGSIYSGKRHARATYNIRIMYDFDFRTRTITYNTIITKNEFDNSFRS